MTSRRRLPTLALAALLLATSCVPLPASPSPSPATSVAASPSPPAATSPAVSSGPADMSATLIAKPNPVADIFDLTRRMRGRDGQPAGEFEPVRTTAPADGIGTALAFWSYDFAAKRPVRITATLRVVTDHAKWWVQNDVAIDMPALQLSAGFFESATYPASRRAYGEEWSPGVDADVRINVLLARIPGSASGYFNSSDELPVWVNEFSSEREMVYINLIQLRPNTRAFNSTVAHELCHMIQYGRRKRSSIWFKEGQAQLCEQINGFAPSHSQTFLQLPDTQLNDWPELESSTPHYGLAYVFLEFLRQQAGGDELINAFMTKGIDTPEDMDAVLRARGQRGLEELFADFVAANAFIGTTGAERRYTYPDFSPGRAAATATEQDRTTVGGQLKTSVRQYAARYVELPRAAIRIHFEGARQTKVLPTDAHSGRAFWWSDRIDGMDARLTRTLDLRGATRPLLSFWTWFDIEKDYDYAYVAASTDGGKRWETLPAQATTTEDPNGANLGNGFTGVSGGGQQAAWVRQEVDLSAYAGKEIQLRFEYVTDPALVLNGFAIDDIEVAGLLRDDAEADNGWQAEGFVRSTNVVSQRFVVQLLRFTANGPTVERRAVEAGTLDLDVDSSADRRAPLVAVTAFAVRTTQPAPFEIAVDARR